MRAVGMDGVAESAGVTKTTLPRSWR